MAETKKLSFSVINEVKSEIELNPGMTVADAITLICGSGVKINLDSAVICLQRNGVRTFGNIGSIVIEDNDVLWVSDRRVDTPVTDKREAAGETTGEDDFQRLAKAFDRLMYRMERIPSDRRPTVSFRIKRKCTCTQEQKAPPATKQQQQPAAKPSAACRDVVVESMKETLMGFAHAMGELIEKL